MRTTEALAWFERLLQSRGRVLASLDAPSALDALLDFYADTRADDVEFDAVYVEWGTFDWGEGPFFQFSVWRQFFVAELTSESDDGLWELEFDYRYPVDDETTGLGQGAERCTDPADAASFRRSLDALAVIAYVARAEPDRVEVLFRQGG